MSNFEPKHTKDRIVTWIRDWFSKNGPECRAVIGISGGKDSTVVAALCVEALGADRVFGVLMPNGEQPDIDIAEFVVNTLGIHSITVNIEDIVSSVYQSVTCGIYDLYRQGGDRFNFSEQTRINLPPRIRMSVLYAISQSIGGRVACTCNLSEEYIGYSTRWGDSVGDFAPIADLTTAEVIEVGEALGLPRLLTRKIPIDGLCGKTDEENFGFTYRALNGVIRGNDSVVSDEDRLAINILHKTSEFKRNPIPYFHLEES